MSDQLRVGRRNAEPREGATSRSDTDWLLEQWRDLRGDITACKNTRILAIGFTIAFVGSALGNLGGPNGTGAAAICLVVVALATVLSIHMTRGIDYTARYIRLYIEPRVTDLKWETRLRRQRIKSTRWHMLRGGFSKSLAWAYLLLGAGIYASWWWTTPGRTPMEVALMSGLGALCFALLSDLYLRWGPGWDKDWTMPPDPDATTNVNPQSASGTQPENPPSAR